MRRSWLVLAVALACLRPPAALGHGDEAHPLKLVGGAWFDGERFVRRDFFSVEGRLLARYAGPVADTVDLAGAYVVSPLADTHSHAFGDTASFARDLRRFLAAGILTVKNPNNPASQAALMRQRVNRPRTVDVLYANGGLTSRGGHPAQIYEGGDPASHRWTGDAYVEVDDAADLEAAWPRVLAGRPDFLKVYLESSEEHERRRADPAFYGRRGLDPRLLAAVVERAHRAGLSVSAHVTSAADFHAAVGAGVDEITHLPLAPIAEADAREAARRRITVVTTVVSHRAPGAELDSLHRENLARLRRAGVRLALGTDHPTATVLDEADRIRRMAVFDDAALLRLLTIETAAAIGPDHRRPRLAPGEEASFVALDGNPLEDFSALRRVRLRVKRGVVVDVPPPPATKPSVADSMMAPLMAGDLEGALGVYDRLRREQPAALDFGEQALNQLGYALLRHRQAAAALAIFRKNAAEFPQSPNVFDSLADGCLAAGDTAAALAAYDRVLTALERTPWGSAEQRRGLESHAREQLARLRPPPR